MLGLKKSLGMNTSLISLGGAPSQGGGVVPNDDPDFLAADVSTSALYGSAVDPAGFYDPVGDKSWLFREAWRGSDRKRVARCTVYDHVTKAMSASYDTFVSFLSNDDHGLPGAVMNNAGYALDAGGQHSGTEGLRISSTTIPRDPSSFVARAEMGAGTVHSYPHPIYIPSTDKLFMFTRSKQSSGPGYMPLLVTPATAWDETGPTWGASQTVLHFGNDSRVYQGQFDQVGTDIYISCCMADWDDTLRRDVYILIYDTLTGNVRNLAGTTTVLAASLPITAANKNAFRVIDHETQGIFGGIPCIAFTDDGKMHMTYVDAPGWNSVELSDGALMHKVYSAGAWSDPVQIGTLRQRYDVFNLVPLPGGKIHVSYTKKGTRLREGDVVFRERSSAGVWTAEATIKAANSMFALGRPGTIKFAKPELIQLFAESVQPPAQGNTGGATNYDATGGSIRVFASGEGGKIIVPSFQLHPKTQTALALMQVAPDKNWAKLYDELIRGLDNGNFFNTMDACYLEGGAHDSQAALVNLMGTDTPLVPVGAMTWETIPGRSVKAWKGGGGGAHMLTPFNPSSTPGMKYGANNNHMGIYSLTPGQGNPTDCGSLATTGANIGLKRWGTDGLARSKNGSPASITGTETGADGLGDIVCARSSSSAHFFSVDGGGGSSTASAYGGSIASQTTGSSGNVNGALISHRLGSEDGSLRQLAFFHFGSAINGVDIGVLLHIKNRFLIGAGAIDAPAKLYG